LITFCTGVRADITAIRASTRADDEFRRPDSDLTPDQRRQINR
jgi:hypothetical protein